ncbi:DHA2 family efflux MFS transporter permease subunit [Dactylosporangium sp. AC04546]|uniref:DHA2 family efflux MFS transporter permease subunit n=1 Tax=Dactylosporangium sp. AC04546 TaxID=2862460 RepID=UPI001EE04824|nr:DHA2 family efflux MFS transporter permease subunit [Dactylosporangium sp. AC04546]WVK86348.1 DHA2 family efflux MFS transporter permease subunit [Dactylosporangium sp. AC04546]
MTDERLDPAVRRLVAVVLLGGVMGILDGSMIAVANTTLADRFHAALTSVGWVTTGYLLALTVTIPVTAWAVDRFGARRLWLFGLGLFLAGSLAAGLSWNLAALVVFRLVQGAGAGIVDPLMPTLLARAAGPARAGRVMGLMGLVGSLGPVAGPVVGGLLLQHLDWRWMLLVNLPIGVTAFVLARRMLPADARPERPARLDLTGLALVAPGVAAVVFGLSRVTAREAHGTWAVLLPPAVGLALLAGYAAHARRRRDTPPLIQPGLFRHRDFTVSIAVVLLVGLGTFGSLFLVPLYYQEVRGHGASAAGMLLAPLGLGSALAMPIAGRLSDRFGTRRLSLIGGCVAVAGAAAFAPVGADTPVAWPVAASFAIGAGLGGASAPAIGTVFRTLPPELVAQGSSVLYMLNQLGAALGVATCALFVQAAGDPLTGIHAGAWWLTATSVLMLAVAPLLPGRPRVTAPAPAAERATQGSAG